MTITKVTSTGTDDHVAIQAAHDAGSDDDTIQLEQLNASTPFDFGAAGSVAISKQIEFVGVGGKPTIEDGQIPFKFDGVGKNAVFKNLNLKNSTEIGLFVKNAADVTIESVDINLDTAEGRGGASVTGTDLFIGILVGSSGSFSIFDGDITGDITIDGCRAELEKTADLSDPYAGNRSVLNPALVSEGGAWPGPGSENPGAWYSMGIHCSVNAEGKKTLVKNSYVSNSSNFGMVFGDNQGLLEIDTNIVVTPYGIHRGGSGIGSHGIIAINASPDLVANFPALRKAHGNWEIKHNNVVLTGKRCNGFTTITFVGGPFKPKSVSVTKNTVVCEDIAQFAMWLAQVDLGYLGQNTVRGTGAFGIACGFTTPFRLFGTDKNGFVGNNLAGFTGTVADIYFTVDSAQNVANGLGNATSLNVGVDNVLTGVTPPAGAIGATLQQILDNFKSQDLP
jgi:hypothetical protein